MENKVKEKIISILKEKGELTFEELSQHMNIDKFVLRKIVADMVRRSILLKVPNFERGKFVYKLA